MLAMRNELNARKMAFFFIQLSSTSRVASTRFIKLVYTNHIATPTQIATSISTTRVPSIHEGKST
jgi:hypothetical protein